jgi:hypothetical protein
MIERLDIRPNDRVLLLSIPEPAGVRRLAARLSNGLLVGLGNEDEVRAARRAAGELDNCMFVLAGPDDIPWSDGFFTVAIDLAPRWTNPESAARELARVLSPGGTVCIGGDWAAGSIFSTAGFEQVRCEPSLLIVRKTA